MFITKPAAHCNIVMISNWHLFLMATLVISPFSAYRNHTFGSCSGLVLVVIMRVFCIAGLLIVV